MTIRQGDSKFDAGEVDQTRCSLANVTVQNVGVSCNTSPSFICLVDISKAHFAALIPGLISSYLYVKELNFCSSQKLGGSPKKNVVEPIQKPD